jgi:hypothetical protein
MAPDVDERNRRAIVCNRWKAATGRSGAKLGHLDRLAPRIALPKFLPVPLGSMLFDGVPLPKVSQLAQRDIVGFAIDADEAHERFREPSNPAASTQSVHTACGLYERNLSAECVLENIANLGAGEYCIVHAFRLARVANVRNGGKRHWSYFANTG